MWPFALAAGLAAAFAWAFRSRETSSPNTGVPPQGLPDQNPKGLTNLVDLISVDNLVPVVFNGEVWLVAPDYIGPIGINEAFNLAKNNGFELPSPGLVDAIWRQADVKLVPQPRNINVPQNAALFADQRARIAAQLAGRDFTLLAGSYKDVVQVKGHPDIYGWHVEDGVEIPFLGKGDASVPKGAFKYSKPVTPGGPARIIQPFSGGAHDQAGPIGYADYSQGARLVKRA